MKKQFKWMLAAILTLCSVVSANAQIDPKVSEILRKSDQVMNNPKGVELTMTMDTRMVVKLTGSTMTIANKGNKSRSSIVMKVMGREIKMEGGFDGTQKWKYEHVVLKEKDLASLKKKGKEMKDTLTIEKATKKPKSNSDIDFDMDKNYKTATVKLNGQCYELTFTNPISKDDPKKTVMKIDKDKYYVREIKANDSGATITMTVTKIKIGVSDDVFKLNINDYPGAVIVRK